MHFSELCSKSTDLGSLTVLINLVASQIESMQELHNDVGLVGTAFHGDRGEMVDATLNTIKFISTTCVGTNGGMFEI